MPLVMLNRIKRKENSVMPKPHLCMYRKFTVDVSWLIGLLLFQSSGSFILSNFSTLLQKHPSIVYFSTMLVGAGGNAGGQSVVYVVRRLATGKKIRNWDLAKTAVGLALCVMLVAVMRFTVQDYLLSWPNPPTAFVLSLSAFVIVFVGAVLGALLPQLFLHLKIDPAYAMQKHKHRTSISCITNFFSITSEIICHAVLP